MIGGFEIILPFLRPIASFISRARTSSLSSNRRKGTADLCCALSNP